MCEEQLQRAYKHYREALGGTLTFDEWTRGIRHDAEFREAWLVPVEWQESSWFVEWEKLAKNSSCTSR